MSRLENIQLSVLFLSCYALPSLIQFSMIPISKGANAKLTESDNHRSIAIGCPLSKILDHVFFHSKKMHFLYYHHIMQSQSSVLCIIMVIEHASITLKMMVSLYTCYY